MDYSSRRRSERLHTGFAREYGDVFAKRARDIILANGRSINCLAGIKRNIMRKYRTMILERALRVLEDVFVELCGKEDDVSILLRYSRIPCLYAEYMRLLSIKRYIFVGVLTQIDALRILVDKAQKRYALAMFEGSSMPLEICEMIADKAPVFNDLPAKCTQASAIYKVFYKSWYPPYMWF